MKLPKTSRFFTAQHVLLPSSGTISPWSANRGVNDCTQALLEIPRRNTGQYERIMRECH